jgi:hypothetical protein
MTLFELMFSYNVKTHLIPHINYGFANCRVKETEQTDKMCSTGAHGDRLGLGSLH